GALPSQLTLSGLAITLRFDQAGHLLTRIPASDQATETLPDIKIENGQITIQQDGHPDFVVTGVHTEVHNQNQQLVLAGSATDPAWGNWTVNGSLDRSTNAGSATLRTPDVHFTPDLLERVPFVPRVVWQQLKAEGDTAAEGVFRYDPAAQRIHYDI